MSMFPCVCFRLSDSLFLSERKRLSPSASRVKGKPGGKRGGGGGGGGGGKTDATHTERRGRARRRRTRVLIPV